MEITTGKNKTKIPTSDIQKNLGGLVVDNDYGPKTTEAVKKFQTDNGLTVDGIFGPETEKAYTTKYPTKSESSLITTSGSSRTKAIESSSALDNALKGYGLSTTPKQDKTTAKDVYKAAGIEEDAGTETDPFIKRLDSLAARSNESTKMLISEIKNKKAQSSESINKQYNDYKSGLQLLGIQTNQASVTPDILMSHINSATSEQQKKITALDSEETKALMEAENAREDNDFKVLTEKMDYVKQIRKDKATALKEYNDALDEASDPVKNNRKAEAIATDIYDVLDTLEDTDKEAFIVAIAEKFNISPLSIVSAISNVEAKKKKESGDEKELSRTDLESYNKQGYNLPVGTTYGEVKEMGIVPKSIKSTSPKTDTIKEATNEITDALKTGKDADGNVIGNPKGEDGYADPSVYLAYYKAWPGTDKEFLAKFPVVGTINPDSYDKLPESIKPKKSSSTKKS